MSVLKGACLFGQSGGPTAVINSSAAGVFLEAMKQPHITEIYGARHGIKGILDEKLYDIRKENIKELELLKNTPSSVLGSVRYKLKALEDDESDYIKILEVFKKYNIRYFFYNGGNDSMDTCNKISKFLKSQDYECRVIGVPKTVDNDLVGTDHCPGYGSAAKYVATTIMELYQDTHVYNTGLITVVEIMGRNAGWLTAAADLANLKGNGPDLIYLPEKIFSVEGFLNDIKKVAFVKKNKVLAVISEGIKDDKGRYISEYHADLNRDSFGHAQLGGAAAVLGGIISDRMNVKVRPIEFSLMQRCAAHIASKTDRDEAYMAGVNAVRYAVDGHTDKMVAFIRDETVDEYRIDYRFVNLTVCANAEKKIPAGWIKNDNSGLTEEFTKYALPLIQGETEYPTEDGLPRFARLKGVFAE